MPDVFEFSDQSLIALHPPTSPFRMTLQGTIAPIAGRGDLHLLGDRLNPEGAPIFVGEGFQDLNRWSSSALAKNTLASLSISLARCSSAGSRVRVP